GPQLLNHLPVRNGVERLHRGDDPAGSEPRNIVAVHTLSVLDSRSPQTPYATEGLQRVKGAADCRIADRVEAHVQLRHRAPSHKFDQLSLGDAGHTTAVEHLRGPAAEGAVEEALH